MTRSNLSQDSVNSRIPGIDAARLLAMIAMFAAHVGPVDRYGALGRLYYFADGLAPILFILVAGMGVTLRHRLRLSTMVEARRRLVWIALFLLASGLWLQVLDHGVRVILQYFFFLYLLGIFALGWSQRALLILVVAMGVTGPVAFLAGLIYAPELYTRTDVSVLTAWFDMPHRLLFSGSYPFLTYAGVFLLGMWLARQELDLELAKNLIFRGLTIGLLALALVVAIESHWVLPEASPDWRWLLVMRPHSQMPMWVISTTGVALALIGVCLMLFRSPGKVGWALVAGGQLALTLYVLHLVVLAVFPTIRTPSLHLATWHTLGMSLVGIGLAAAWKHWIGIGPFEALVQWPWRRRFR